MSSAILKRLEKLETAATGAGCVLIGLFGE